MNSKHFELRLNRKPSMCLLVLTFFLFVGGADLLADFSVWKRLSLEIDLEMIDANTTSRTNFTVHRCFASGFWFGVFMDGLGCSCCGRRFRLFYCRFGALTSSH